MKGKDDTMKKIFALALASVMGLALISGCGEEKKTETNTVNAEENEKEPEVIENEFYVKMKNSKSRPIAVMIDNDADYTGPHSGLENAYLIYEIYVEGGSTRMMALFKEDLMSDEAKAERIGPVRSSRHYFLDFALENDAVYAHCGWSPKAQSEISSRGVNNINGLYESAPFERYSAYNSSWHNLYTSVDKLKKSADGHGYRDESDVLLNYSPEIKEPEGGVSALKVTIPYLSYTMSYEYDADNGVYMRYKKGAPHTMQSGVQLSAQNILILRMENFNLNDGDGKGRQDLKDTGTGSGTFISEGKAVNITWEKSDRSARTKYYLEDKSELELNPGVTIVQIVPGSMNVTIE